MNTKNVGGSWHSVPMDELEDSPPRRTRAQLEEWVREFEAEGRIVNGSVRVAQQEDTAQQDTGLVVMSLRNANASIYMQPKGYDEPLWEATLTGRPDDLSMTVHDIQSLAAELVIAGNLCSFLQWKSLEWDRRSGTHG